jgi:hypothetical protein
MFKNSTNRKECLFLISDHDENTLPFYERWMQMSIHVKRKNQNTQSISL